MQVLYIWIIFDHFWAILDPQILNLQVPFLAIFPLQNIGMWGVFEEAISFYSMLSLAANAKI